VNTLLTVKLAHDLRNLLTIMASCAESIQAMSPRHATVDAELAFAELDGAIESGFAISRELLALGRTQDAQRSIIDVNELVMQAEGVMRRMLGAKVELSLDLHAIDPIVEAEVVHVEWILLNLVANARDAMPSGGVLKIETASVERAPTMLREAHALPGRYLRLKVTDTGHSIVRSVLDKVFEPFFTTRSDHEGLGLTSVAVTVHALRGRLHVESRSPRPGTSVHVFLPIFSRSLR
jgi:two-component system, cell cycle sensor histidine kinase and response regulator CckA